MSWSSDSSTCTPKSPPSSRAAGLTTKVLNCYFHTVSVCVFFGNILDICFSKFSKLKYGVYGNVLTIVISKIQFFTWAKEMLNLFFNLIKSQLSAVKLSISFSSAIDILTPIPPIRSNIGFFNFFLLYVFITGLWLCVFITDTFFESKHVEIHRNIRIWLSLAQ